MKFSKTCLDPRHVPEHRGFISEVAVKIATRGGVRTPVCILHLNAR